MAYTTIDDPSAHFHTQLYSGTGSAQSITNDANAGDFQPDWVWVKKRTGGTARNHTLTDSTRGATKGLFSSLNDAEATNAQGLTSFNSDGFSVGTYNNFNESDGTYVAWQWKANGGTTSSNSDGSITSTVQANTTAGFSIVTYTGTGSNATVGHGLGATPKAYIVKNRTDAADWFVYHGSLGTPVNEYVQLNSTNAVGSNSGTWNSNPTSSVFGLGSTFGALNGSSKNYVAYVFAEKQGYSKIGSYTGNGNDDGPFVYTGFKPAWLLIKRTDSAQNWNLHDNKRSTFNTTKADLFPNLNNAEETGNGNFIDFLSNGFKHRASTNSLNASSGDFIYMAFAEHPFVSSKGVPVTAR
jgi:hypothetical protein